MRVNRPAISSWQPSSAGVTEARAIRSCVRSSVADIGLLPKGHGALYGSSAPATRGSVSVWICTMRHHQSQVSTKDTIAYFVVSGKPGQGHPFNGPLAQLVE